MASTSTPNKLINDSVGDENKNCDGRPKSHFQKTVCLEDWWLLKAENDFEGSGLAVAGFASREQRAVRFFSSAPILMRYDVFTLETTDGICVIIKGFINKARTAENGFPSDVFDHFVFGFPPYWKEYAEKCIVAGGQSHLSSHERGAGSQDEMGATGLRKSNKTASSTYVLPPQSDSVETPGIEKERVHSGSPQSLCFNRSRSGRLLMPTLEFWRNQRALYGADGTVTGIEEEIHQEQPTRGYRSTRQKKRRQLL